MNKEIKIKWIALGVLATFGTGYVVQNNPLEASETEHKVYVQAIKTGEVAVYERKRLPLSERRVLPEGAHADNYPWF